MCCAVLFQDVEVPLHLLRYVCLFCGKHGLSLMKECFESGTPESLPFPIAHAFITIVSNVSPAAASHQGELYPSCTCARLRSSPPSPLCPQIRIWLHIPAVMQHIIPFRTYVIR